jgi:signal transduction histidine kinase
MAIAGRPTERVERRSHPRVAPELGVLVLAPWGRDGALIGDALRAAGVAVEVCADAEQFAPRLERVGALVFTADALTEGMLGRLERAIEGQPLWSTTPVILLLTAEAAAWQGPSGALLRRLCGQVTVLELPLEPQQLVSVARSAIDTRRRQLESRDAWRALEATVVQRDSSLRRSALDLTRAEQLERQRLAHLLHDDVQQLLVAAQMHLALLDARLSAHGGAPEIQTVTGLIAEAITASRVLASDLSPPSLGRGGLGKALVRLGGQLFDLHRLTVTVDADRDVEVSNPTAAAFLLDATRELLFNVVKHAGVKLAHVELVQADGEVRVTIADHGVGLPEGGRSSHRGFGLARIQERLENLGGRMVESVPRGGGHSVLIAVPAVRVRRVRARPVVEAA